MKARLAGLGLAGVAAWAARAGAADFRYVEPAAPPAPSLAGLLLRTALALAVVIGLVYLTAWALRKAQPGLARGRGRGGRASEVEVESHVALGPKRSLYSVRWGKFRLLLGAGAAEITLLASEWTEGGEPPGEARGELPDEAQFGRRLDDFLSRLGRLEDEH
ncbi:MAG TPA: flagellar biosynthetic protein FliO [Candidatus Saccharimonadales bacterium]|nr:flagellar biosynthetic protein FliO [Candidatus Saccharimonadales bacterium]